jgi:hypothetical protein
MAKWQRIRIELPKELGPAARERIGIELRNRMQERANNGLGVRADGKGSKAFPDYSDSYKKFKGKSGRSTSPVNLIFDGDMLAELNLISHKPGSVLIGFENGSEQNAKAEGNILGSYGRSPNPAKARNFLGLPVGEIKRIIAENKEG